MRRSIDLGLLAVLIAVAGCGQRPNLELEVPAALSPAAKDLAVAAWPKIKQACVGLDRYAKGIKIAGIQENTTIDVLVSVPETGSGVPDRYMASGQTCYFSLAPDGKSLSVAKEGCKALCLDRSIQPGEELDKADFRVDL